MAYIQRDLPNPPKTLSFNINMFTGGLNNVVAETLIQDNQSSDMVNFDFTLDGVLETRGGLKKHSTISDKTITFMDIFNSTYSDKRTICVSNGNVYIDGILLLSDKNIIEGVQFNDKYYFVNGNDTYVLGKFPTEANTHIVITGTAISDEVVMKLSSPPNDFTPLDTTNTIGVYHYNFTDKTYWYEPCKNELDDEYKGANIIPNNPSIIRVHKERLYVISDEKDPGSIYISDIDSGCYYPSILGLHIPPTGDRIVGAEIFTDSLVVGTHDNLYVVYGDTNRDGGNQYNIKHINSHTGFKNKESIKVMHNYLIFLGNDDNIYSMYTTKTDVDMLMTAILNKTVNFYKAPILADVEMLKKTSIAFYKDNIYMLIPDLKIIMLYSYRYMAWNMYKTELNLQFVNKIEDELLFGDDSGNLYILDKDTFDDDGKIFEAHWNSKRMSFGDDTLYKKFKEIYLVAHTYEEIRSDIRMRYEIDYVDIKQQEVITNKKAIWGISKFGDRFINRNISPSFPITIGQRGRFIKFIIYNGYWLKGTVQTYDDLNNIERENQQLYYVTDENSYYFFDLGVWVKFDNDKVKQPMKLYNVSGTYQLKGRR